MIEEPVGTKALDRMMEGSGNMLSGVGVPAESLEGLGVS